MYIELLYYIYFIITVDIMIYDLIRHIFSITYLYIFVIKFNLVKKF